MFAMQAHDYGTWGPLFVRLAWHASGTYDPSSTIIGGSYGATMRFEPESSDGANNGLGPARDRLEMIKTKYPWISYGDLWTLAAVVSIRDMGTHMHMRTRARVYTQIGRAHV